MGIGSRGGDEAQITLRPRAEHLVRVVAVGEPVYAHHEQTLQR